jgi:vitamin B12 transporter
MLACTSLHAGFFMPVTPSLNFADGGHRMSPQSNKKYLRVSLLCVLSFTLNGIAVGPRTTAAEAAEQIVTVTANYVPLPVEESGSSVTIFTEEDIARRQTPIATDIIRSAPGLAVSRAGNIGQVTQIRTRGAEGNHTLVLIDGVEANDPFNSAEFNFANLMTSDIEHIEVLRGPQSALYGSEALGGVISIVTKSGDEGWTINGSGEAGSFQTRNGSLGISGGEEKWHAALNAQTFSTHGTNISRFGDEEDGFDNSSVNLRGSVTPLENIRLGANLRYNVANTQSDPQDFAFPPNPTDGLVVDGDQERKSQFFYGGAWGQVSLFDDKWTHKVSGQLLRARNKNLTSNIFTGRDRSAKNSFAYQSDLAFDLSEVAQSSHGLSFLVEREIIDFLARGPLTTSPENQDRTTGQTGIAGEYRLALWDRLFLSASARHDNNDIFADVTTYRVTGSLRLPESGTRIHGSHGTGVANPNLFELYGFFPGSFVGNPVLKPESSKGFDIGVEQSLLDSRIVADVTYFKAGLQDEIVTVFGGPPLFLATARNLTGRSTREGVEISVMLKPLDQLQLTGSYTYLQAEEPGGLEEIRRPRHTANVNVNLTALNDKANFNLDIFYNGRQQDSEFSSLTPATRATLDAYTLVNLAASYEICKGVRLTARGENLLNQHYEEIYSYRSSGIAAYAGVSFEFVQ